MNWMGGAKQRNDIYKAYSQGPHEEVFAGKEKETGFRNYDKCKSDSNTEECSEWQNGEETIELEHLERMISMME